TVLRRLPTPRRLPYTTLFRSIQVLGPVLLVRLVGALELRRRVPNRPSLVEVQRQSRHHGPQRHPRGCERAHVLLRVLQGRALEGVRKSTRLNSSHVSIAYAVF